MVGEGLVHESNMSKLCIGNMARTKLSSCFAMARTRRRRGRRWRGRVCQSGCHLTSREYLDVIGGRGLGDCAGDGGGLVLNNLISNSALNCLRERDNCNSFAGGSTQK